MVHEAMALGVAIAVFAIARYLQIRARRQLHWQQVSGAIVASSAGFGSQFFPEVQYRYAIGGRTHLGLEIRSHLFMGNFPGYARRVLAKFPVGATVTVYVDPANPANAVLEPGGDARFFVFLYCF